MHHSPSNSYAKNIAPESACGEADKCTLVEFAAIRADPPPISQCGFMTALLAIHCTEMPTYLADLQATEVVT
jgi:hypothetical protein